MIPVMRLYLPVALLIAVFSGVSNAKSPERRMLALVQEGRWLTARELAEDLLKQDPKNAKVGKQLELLESKVRHDAENLDFDPRKYFYAEAYLDYFQSRYAEAVEDLEQVLVFELENEEVLRFMDKAQALSADQAKALLKRIPELYRRSKYREGIEVAQRVLALSPSNAQAREWIERLQTGEISVLLGGLPALVDGGQYEEASQACRQILGLDPENVPAKQWLVKIELARHPQEPVPVLTPVAPPPAPSVPAAVAAARPAPAIEISPEWIDQRYRQALKAYVHRDLPKARSLLREILARDPDNQRCKKALERIQKELP